jgi:uncharacterized protein YjbI with pentapeptide repeats
MYFSSISIDEKFFRSKYDEHIFCLKQGKNWHRLELINYNLREIDLSNLCLIGADLRYCDFRSNQLISTNLEGADLRGARFDYSRLVKVNFKSSNMCNTNFTGADFKDCLGKWGENFTKDGIVCLD